MGSNIPIRPADLGDRLSGPQARPVDTFVRPVDAPFMFQPDTQGNQLAQALDRLAGNVANFSSTTARKNKDNKAEAEAIEEVTRRANENRQSLAEKTRSGEILAGFNPWVKDAAEGQLTKILASRFDEDIRLAYAQGGSGDVNKLVQDKTREYLELVKPFRATNVTKNFLPRMQASVDNLISHDGAEKAKAIEKETYDNLGQRVVDTMRLGWRKSDELPLSIPVSETPRGQAIVKQFTTPLSPDEEQRFQAWAEQNLDTNPGFSDWRDPYADYDYRGAFKDNLQASMESDGKLHLSDKYKRPWHPTFSNESTYSKGLEAYAGSWPKEAKSDADFVGSQEKYPDPRQQTTDVSASTVEELRVLQGRAKSLQAQKFAANIQKEMDSLSKVGLDNKKINKQVIDTIETLAVESLDPSVFDVLSYVKTGPGANLADTAYAIERRAQTLRSISNQRISEFTLQDREQAAFDKRKKNEVFKRMSSDLAAGKLGAAQQYMDIAPEFSEEIVDTWKKLRETPDKVLDTTANRETYTQLYGDASTGKDITEQASAALRSNKISQSEWQSLQTTADKVRNDSFASSPEFKDLQDSLKSSYTTGLKPLDNVFAGQITKERAAAQARATAKLLQWQAKNPGADRIDALTAAQEIVEKEIKQADTYIQRLMKGSQGATPAKAPPSTSTPKAQQPKPAPKRPAAQPSKDPKQAGVLNGLINPAPKFYSSEAGLTQAAAEYRQTGGKSGKLAEFLKKSGIPNTPENASRFLKQQAVKVKGNKGNGTP